MKLKKANAILGLLMILVLVVHMIYEDYRYLTMNADMTVTRALGHSFALLVVIHVAISVWAVCVRAEGWGKKVYWKENIRTMLQRISAVLILVLLPLHIAAFRILAAGAGRPGLFVLVNGGQVLFFVCIVIHGITGFSRALITLGMITDKAVQRRVDWIAGIVLAIIAAASAVIEVYVQAYLFLGGGL